MTKKLFLTGILLLAVASLALAADAITGKWVYEQAGRNGGPARQTTLDLKADGAKLTGTVTMPPFGPPPGGGGDAPPPMPPGQITNGKIEGNKITFDVTRETPMGEMTSKYEGVVSGNQMNLKVTRPGMDGQPMTQEVVAKKQ